MTDESTKNGDQGLEGHEYDGIRELDNQLPSWWLATFYGTVAFAVAYFFYYSVAGGPTLVQEYQQAKREAEIAQLSVSSAKTLSDDELKPILADSTRRHAGHELFESKCAACHGQNGQGVIGPNLTDDYWLHGGKPSQIVHTITVGVPDKGMPPWGTLIKKDEIYSLVAFIRSIHGTNPAAAKPPQGELFKE